MHAHKCALKAKGCWLSQLGGSRAGAEGTLPPSSVIPVPHEKVTAFTFCVS